MGSEMKTEITTQLIKDTIRSEMVRQIGGDNKQELIKSVVKHAMTQQKDHYSSAPTYLKEGVNTMIREEAKNIFKEWIDKNRKEISAALYKHLNGNKQKRLKEFCERIADNIEQYGITVNLDFRQREKY